MLLQLVNVILVIIMIKGIIGEQKYCELKWIINEEMNTTIVIVVLLLNF